MASPSLAAAQLDVALLLAAELGGTAPATKDHTRFTILFIPDAEACPPDVMQHATHPRCPIPRRGKSTPGRSWILWPGEEQRLGEDLDRAIPDEALDRATPDEATCRHQGQGSDGRYMKVATPSTASQPAHKKLARPPLPGCLVDVR